MSSSPHQSAGLMTSDKEATLMSTASSKGETLVIRKAIERQLDHLRHLSSQTVDEDTDLEQRKNYQASIIP